MHLTHDDFELLELKVRTIARELASPEDMIRTVTEGGLEIISSGITIVKYNGAVVFDKPKTYQPGEWELQVDELFDRAIAQRTICAGDLECQHPRVYYVDSRLSGQAWYCDDCDRQEFMPYHPTKKMAFPPHSFISTPNPMLGMGKYYSHQANDKGLVVADLPREAWRERNL